MKKLYVLIITMIISIISAFGQVQEYECNIPFSEKNAFLTLCDNNVYIFGIRLDYKDIYHESIISEGFYEQKRNNKIVLNDQVNGYQMIVKKGENNDLYMVKCIDFFRNYRLTFRKNHGYNEGNYDSTYYTLNYTLDKEYSLEELMKEREMYRKQTTLRDFKPGVYSDSPEGFDDLIINENGTYLNLMTKGTWKREGNLITFYDECLGKAFTAFIEDGYIVVKHMFYYSKYERFQIYSE